MDEEDLNDMDRIAGKITEAVNVLTGSSHEPHGDSDSITVTKDGWIAAVIQLQRLRDWTSGLGETHRTMTASQRFSRTIVQDDMPISSLDEIPFVCSSCSAQVDFGQGNTDLGIGTIVLCDKCLPVEDPLDPEAVIHKCCKCDCIVPVPLSVAKLPAGTKIYCKDCPGADPFAPQDCWKCSRCDTDVSAEDVAERDIPIGSEIFCRGCEAVLKDSAADDMPPPTLLVDPPGGRVRCLTGTCDGFMKMLGDIPGVVRCNICGFDERIAAIPDEHYEDGHWEQTEVVIPLTLVNDSQTKVRGTNADEYQIYVDCAGDGNGNDKDSGQPLKTFDEWLNS